jgi:ABC-type Fe3+ transport system permease subunit
MLFIYSALICLVLGILVWIAGNIVHKREKSKKKTSRSKPKNHAETLAIIAKLIFLLAAFFFVIGFMLLGGTQTG